MRGSYIQSPLISNFYYDHYVPSGWCTYQNKPEMCMKAEANSTYITEFRVEKGAEF